MNSLAHRVVALGMVCSNVLASGRDFSEDMDIMMQQNDFYVEAIKDLIANGLSQDNLRTVWSQILSPGYDSFRIGDMTYCANLKPYVMSSSKTKKTYRIDPGFCYRYCRSCVDQDGHVNKLLLGYKQEIEKCIYQLIILLDIEGRDSYRMLMNGSQQSMDPTEICEAIQKHVGMLQGVEGCEGIADQLANLTPETVGSLMSSINAVMEGKGDMVKVVKDLNRNLATKKEK